MSVDLINQTQNSHVCSITESGQRKSIIYNNYKRASRHIIKPYYTQYIGTVPLAHDLLLNAHKLFS